MVDGKNKLIDGDMTEKDINGCISNHINEDIASIKNSGFIKTQAKEKRPYRRALSSILKTETPTYTILTNGLVPDFINMKWLRTIENYFILNCPLGEVYKSLDIFKKAQRHYCLSRKENESYLDRFCDFQGGCRYLSVRNMTAATCSVSINKSITLKSDNSTVILSFDDFLKCVEIFEPDMFCIPSEDIKVGAPIGKKKKIRIGKLMEEYLEKVKCLKENPSNVHMYNSLNHSLCIVSIPSTIENINEIICGVLKKYDDIIDGYVLNGLGYKETVKERTKCLQRIMPILSKTKKKIVQLDVGNPVEILHSIYNGIDLVEVKFPFTLAQNGKAIFLAAFKMDLNHTPSKIYHINDIDFTKSDRFLLDLTKPEFIFDYAPISENSPRQESRSYIHHLLQCKEMTAVVLLTYHNLYMYSLFFKEIQTHVQCNNLENYISWFIEQNKLF